MKGTHKGIAGVTILVPGLTYSLKKCWSNRSQTYFSCSQITAITLEDQEVSRNFISESVSTDHQSISNIIPRPTIP